MYSINMCSLNEWMSMKYYLSMLSIYSNSDLTFIFLKNKTKLLKEEKKTNNCMISKILTTSSAIGLNS